MGTPLYDPLPHIGFGNQSIVRCKVLQGNTRVGPRSSPRFCISLVKPCVNYWAIPTPLLMHWRQGIRPALSLSQCIMAVLCVAFVVHLVPNFIVCLVVGTCLSSPGRFVCLVGSFRYNGLATLALAGPSGPQRPLRARGGPFGPAMH